MSAPSPVAVPVGASTITKILLTIAAVLGVISATTWPTGVFPQLGAYSAIGSVVLTSVAGIIHTVWDHS